MDINALKSNLQSVIALRDEIEGVTNSSGRFGYQLSDYVEQARQQINSVGHGDQDRFFVPQWDAGNKLDQLQEKEPAKINSAFATSKTRLVSILNRYIRDMQRGLQAHEAETGSIPPA